MRARLIGAAAIQTSVRPPGAAACPARRPAQLRRPIPAIVARHSPSRPLKRTSESPTPRTHHRGDAVGGRGSRSASRRRRGTSRRTSRTLATFTPSFLREWGRGVLPGTPKRDSAERMGRNAAAPTSDARVADAKPGNWVDRLAPGSLKPYLELGGSTGRSATGCCCGPAGGRSPWRRAKPPTAGASRSAAGSGWPDPVLLALFYIGAVAMAGGRLRVQRYRRPRYRRRRGAHRPASPAQRPDIGRAGRLVSER